MRSRKTTDTRKLMDQAADYATWRTHAAELDALEHLDEWKNNPNSTFYQHKLIQQRLINLRNWRLGHDGGGYWSGFGCDSLGAAGRLGAGRCRDLRPRR